MNEQAIVDSYNLAVQNGYKKSIDDFKQLISTNSNALNDIYNLSVQNGYKKSLDDYKVLVGLGAAPAPAQQPAEVKKKDDTMESPLEVGSLASSASADPEALRFGELASGIQKKQKSGIPVTPATSPEFQKELKEAPIRKAQEDEELAQAQLSASNEFDKLSEKPRIEQSKYLNEQLVQINKDLIGKTEEQVVPEMEYRFGKLGFKFEEAKRGRDYMDVTAPNGEKTQISLDNFLESTSASEALKLQKFIQDKTPQKGLFVLEKTFREQDRTFNSQKEVDIEAAKINEESTNLNKKQKDFILKRDAFEKEAEELNKTPESQWNTPEFIKKFDELQKKGVELDNEIPNILSEEEKLKKKASALDRSVGRYFLSKSKQGTFYSGIANELLAGGSSILADYFGRFLDISTEILPTGIGMGQDFGRQIAVAKADKIGAAPPVEGQSMDAWKETLTEKQLDAWEDEVDDAKKKFQKKDLVPAARESLQTLSEKYLMDRGVTPEFIDLTKQGFWGGAILGLARSLPAMIGRNNPTGWVQRTSQMYAQVSDGLMQEMEKDPAFAEISESEKAAIIAPIGIVSSALEAYGLRNVLQSKGVITSITMSVLGKAGKGASYTSLRELAENEIKSGIAKGAIIITAAGAAEFETGAAQQLAETGFKTVYNKLKEEKLFQTPESLGKVAKEMVYAGGQEMVGGFILSIPNAVSVAYSKKGFLKMDDATFEAFENMANDGSLQSAYIISLKEKIASGKMFPADAKEELQNYRTAVGVYRQLPDGLTIQQKKEAMNLLKEKKDLESYISGKDTALVSRQKNRIDEINQELSKISEQGDAQIQAETNDDVKKRNERIAELNKAIEDDDTAIEYNLSSKLPTLERQKIETELQTLKSEEDAIQEQAAGQVPVQPTATVGQEVEGGEPQTEPQGITKENIKEKITEVNNKSAELQRRQQLELEELNKKENKNYRDAFDILNVNEYSEDQTPRSQEAIDLANRHTQEFNESLQEKRNIESEADKLNFSDYNLTDNNKLETLRESINSVYETNRTALDEGFEASVNALDEANSVGGNNYLAHGMGKTNLANAYNDLINLFKKGINPIRGRGSLDVAPLSGGVSTGTTASGNAYMDGPFTLVANRNHSGPITNINQVGGIIVNEGLATPEVLASLRDLFPNLAIESTSNTKSLIEQLNSKTKVTPQEGQEKITVFRGKGNNVMSSDNESTLWVAEEEGVAKNYAGVNDEGKLEVEKIEVEKPKNSIELPYKLATDVRASNIGDNLRAILKRLKDEKKISGNKIREAANLIKDFEEKAGNNLELFTTKINKPESREAFSKAAQALGFDSILQKESESEGGTKTNTYGIFKTKYPSLIETSSTQPAVQPTVSPAPAKKGKAKPAPAPVVEEVITKKESYNDIISREDAAARKKQQLDKDNAKRDIDLIESENKEVIEKYFKKSGYKEITGNETDTRLKGKKGVYKITGPSIIIKKDKKSAALDSAISISNKKIQGLSNSRIEQINKEFESAKKEAKAKTPEVDAVINEETGTLESALDFLDSVDKTITQTLRTRANDALLGIPLTVIQGVVKGLKVLVQGGMKLRDAIKQISEENNISQEKLRDILDIASIQEDFNTLMDKADKLIATQKSKDIPEKKIVSNLDKMVRDFYKDLDINDAQRKIMEREARARMGVEPRKAASIGRVLGVLKDIANVTREEKLNIISRIRELGRDVGKDLAKEIRDMADSGKITVNQAASIIARTLNINPLNEASVSNFVDYMSNVFADAEYRDAIDKVNRKLSRAKKNIDSKIGIADTLRGPLNKLLSINPLLIPEKYLDRYVELVDMLSANQQVLGLEQYDVVKSDTDAILRAVNEEQSRALELADVLENSENQVIVEGKLDYAATLNKMINKGEIDEKDAKLMRKYKKDILPQAESTKLSEDEIKEKKKKAIETIKKTKVDGITELPSEEERKFAQEFADILDSVSVENLMKLSLSELNNLIKTIDNIKNGYLTAYAYQIAQRIEGLSAEKVLDEATAKASPPKVSTAIAKIKNLITEKGALLEAIRRIPLFNIDQVLGNFKGKEVFNALLLKTAQAETKFKTELKRINSILEKAEQNVAKSFSLNQNKIVESKMKMMTYMIQLEYESNQGNEQVNPASEYIKKTIDHINKARTSKKYGQRDVKILNKILNEYSTDGQIDIKKLYDSFNQAEKDAVNDVRKINEGLKNKAEFTSSIIRGDVFDGLNNYVHLNVLNNGPEGDIRAANDIVNMSENNLNPSTKAKSLIKRTKEAKPISFDIFSSASRGAKYTLLDYHLTRPIRTARIALNQLDKTLDGRKNVTKLQREVSNALNAAYNEAVNNLLVNSIMEDSLGDQIVNYIGRMGYRSVLAGTGRFAAELTSNISFALIANPQSFTTGSKYANIIMSPMGPKILENISSTQSTRIYPEDDLSAKFMDTSAMNQRIGMGSRSKNPVINKVQQLWNLTGKRYTNAVEALADNMISTPDKIVIRAIWFGSFANEFKKATGKEVDFKLIAENNEKYLRDNKEAIDSARAAADQTSVQTGATDNAFMGILKGVSKPNQKPWLKVYNNFNNYMTRFLIFEYMSARTGVYAMMGEGMMTRTQGAMLLAAVATRMTVYSLLSRMLADGILGLAYPLFGIEDEEEEEESFLQRLGQAFAGSVGSLFFGRDFGNAVKLAINLGLEEFNEEYLGFLREGEYDQYEDAIAYSIIPRGKEDKTTLGDFAFRMGGSFGPALQTSSLIFDNYVSGAIPAVISGGTTKKEADAIERESRVVKERIPLEILGNLGFVPLYKDVRRAALKSIYSDLEKSKGKVEDFTSIKQKSEKIKDLRSLKEVTTDDDELRAIRRRMLQVNGTPEQKESVENYNKIKEGRRKKLLYDSENSVRYDNESELKRYNPNLYKERFGVGSEWYDKYNADNSIESKLSKTTRKREDEEYGYKKKN
jgi:hypothetical protein